MLENMEKHPCYGMVGFKRRSGSSTPLFGSSIQHNNTIVMTLKHGKLARELNGDHYFGDEVIAEVEMSYSQFAEAITALNMGDGVPCTIIFTEKDGMVHERPFKSKREQFEQELSEHLEEIKREVKQTMDEVSKIFDKKSIGKGDKEEILRKIERIHTQIGSNTEFVYRQFNRQMDKTVLEAKGEIEAFCQNKMHSIAMATLSENKDSFEALESPVVFEQM